MSSGKYDFSIWKGSTVDKTLRWQSPPYIYKQIQGVTNSAPVKINCTGHGLPNGWTVLVESVKGMTQINSNNDKDWKKVDVLDANNFEINDTNSIDYKPYAGGGVIRYLTPVDLTGFTARMTIRDKIGGTEILKITTENGSIILDVAQSSVILKITALQTATITQKKGVYDLEMVSLSGDVSKLISGNIHFVSESTT